jgi:hypothetical protein
MDETNPFDQFDDAQDNPFDQFDSEQLPETPNSVAERTVSLPVPRPNMFADMSDEDAAMTYDAYRRHPETQQTEDGQLLYKGQAVPAPEGNSGVAAFMAGLGQRVFSGMSPAANRARREVLGENPDELSMSENIGRGVGGGLVDAASNAGQLAGAIATSSPLPQLIEGATGIDVLPEAVHDVQDTIASGMEDNLPNFNPEGTAQSISGGLTEAGVGIVIGNKAMAAAKAAGATPAALESLATKVPRAAKYLTSKFVSSVGAGAGTAVTVDGDSDTLVTGENAFIPILQGLDTNSESEMENLINKRMNVLIDSAIVAMPIEMGADGGKKVLKFAYKTFVEPIQKVISKDKKSVMIMEELMDAVGQAADSADPNSPAALAAKQRVVDIMKTPDFQQMTVQTGKQGVDDVAFRRDTASAVEAGLSGDTSEQADAIRGAFRSNRKRAVDNAEGSGYQQTQIAAERPTKETERLLSQSEEVFGGDLGTERARAGIQTQASKEIAASDQAAADVQTNADRAASELPMKMREGQLGEQISMAESNPISQARQIRNETAEDLLGTEREISQEIDDTARVKWENIPEGLEADPESLTLTLADAKDYLDRKTLQEVEKAGFVFDPEAADDMVVDFKALQNIRKPLTNEISRRIKGNEPGVSELMALRDNLNKVQPDFVIETQEKAGKEGAKAVKEAVDYERTVRGPERKSGLPGELRTIRKQKGLDAPKRGDMEREALHKTMTSDQPETPSHFVNYIMKHRPEKKGLITQYAFADASDKLLRKIKVGEGISSIDPSEIMGSMEQYRQILNSNPEAFADELKELDNFYNAIVRNKNDVKKLQELAKEHAGKAEKFKKDMYEEVLNDFFEKSGAAKPNGYAALRDLYMLPQATGAVGKGKLDEVIRLAKETGDPAVLDGMKAGWMKLVRDSVFNNSPDAASARTLSAAKADDYLKGTGKSNLRLVGEKLFEDQDKVLIEALDRVLQPALDNTVAAKSAASATGKGSDIRDAKEAVAAGVRLKYGPLTRKGTTINTVVGKLLDYFVKNKKQEAALDAIMADPDGFLKAYDLFVKSNQPAKEKYRHLFRWAVNSGIYNESDKNKFDKEFRELNTEDQTEGIIAKK